MRSTGLLLLGAIGAAAAIFFLPDVLGRSLFAGGGLETGAIGGGLGALGLAWMGGVLTSLTPCVYPLIPITLGVLGARQGSSRWKSIGLTTTYVLGIALMFSGLGFAAASSGKAFGTILANRWVLAGLAAFFAIMAASMLGAFQIALPQALSRRLVRVGGSSGFGGALAMGLVAGLVAAPCTGPVLAALLTFVASAGQPGFGVLLLFTYALGIGLPFFLIGVFSLSLPRSGPWMDGVKSVFGIALLAMALLYLKTAWPELGALASGRWAMVLAPVGVAAGVLLGAVHRPWHGDAAGRVLKGAGIAVAVLGIFLRLAGPAGAAEGGSVAWVSDHDGALADARAAGKPVMIDFFAEWCAACKELDKYTYTDPAVIAEADRFVNLKIDGTVEDAKILALYEKYAVKGLPTIVFIGADGEVMEQPRVTGFVDAPRFLDLMEQVR